MARDSTMGRDRVLAVPSTGIALETPSTSQLTAGPLDINQQILEVTSNLLSRDSILADCNCMYLKPLNLDVMLFCGFSQGIIHKFDYTFL